MCYSNIAAFVIMPQLVFNVGLNVISILNYFRLSVPVNVILCVQSFVCV